MRASSVHWICVALLALAGCGSRGDDATPPPPLAPLGSGEIDAGYGTGGEVSIAAPDAFYEMAVLGDGSVYLTGDSIRKLDPAGRVASGYGQDGRVSIPAVSPVVDGSGNLYAISGHGVVKVDSAGRLDPSFGVGGRVEGVFNDYRELQRLVRDADGNLYVAGPIVIGSPAVTQLGPDGRVKARFAAVGTGNSQGFSEVQSLTLDAQSNVAVGGLLFVPGAGAQAIPRIIKFDRNSGLPLADFGADGVLDIPDCAGGAGVFALAAAPPDGLAWGGSCFALGLNRATMQVIDRRGLPVAGFGNLGFTLFGPTTPGGLVVESQRVSALRAHASGFYVGGHRRGLRCEQGAIAKVDANGQRIAGFGFGGYAAFDEINFVRSLGTDAAGRVYLGGIRFAGCTSQPHAFVVYRLGG